MIWFLAGLACGWAVCWKLGAVITRTVIRRPKSEVTIRFVSTLSQEALVSLRSAVEAEVAKRRAA